ncbi:lipopolysaccharide biosynthesis protein [Cellulophaga baltica]|uniref:Na+-driven multidrug efflux pump n=1 Tax=Cellulophaga baltica TaxID=76594 RepID=A0A1G7H6H0_9FLAO|nr:hypothetical protein [Cellulophaga baltica]SDE95971.1 Na+-driven multidrug efflux pump [Cellulophaga baltica]
MSLKKRLVNNGLASILSKGVRVLEQLFLVPFFIAAWGAAYYGEWITLTIIPSVMAFSNLGFGSAAANSLVLTYASGDKQKAANICKTGFYIITIMVLIAIVLGAIAIYVLDIFHVFDKSLINSQDAILAVSILIIARLLNFYDQLIESFYRAAQRAALSINLLTIRAALNLAAGLFVLLLEYGIVAFAISQLIVTVLFSILYWLKGRSVLGLYKNYTGTKDAVILKGITTKGLSYLMLPVWQIIYFQGTTFVVRIVLGPEAVAIFNTARTLSRSLNQLLYLVEPTVFPELQIAIGKNDWKTAKQIFRVSIIGVFLLSLIGVIFLAIFGLWFYNIWTNNELELPQAMWYTLISAMLFNALWYTSEMVFRAVNQPKRMGIYGIIAAILSVLLTYLFATFYGITGAAIGAVSLDLILVFLVVPNGCKIMKMSMNDLVSHGADDFRELFQKILKKIKK